MTLMLVGFASAEMTSWNDVIIDNSTQIVKYHGFYYIDDTPFGVGQTTWEQTTGLYRPVEVILMYATDNLPYGTVDWCNLTITEFHNIYSSSLSKVELINTTTNVSSYYFDTGANNGQLEFTMYNRDYLTADMICHDSNLSGLYYNNELVGHFDLLFPAYDCKCDQDLTTLNNEIENAENQTSTKLQLYGNIQTVVDWNFRFWLYGYWIIQILFLIIAIAVIFLAGYWVYALFKKILREI
jgi:hypothetical protein